MEKNPLFTETLTNRFEILHNKLAQESKDLKQLSAFFQSIRKDLENLAKSMSKSVTSLKGKTQVQSNSFSDTLSYAMKAVASNTEEYCKTILKQCSTLNSEITTPLDEFINSYEQSYKAVLSKLIKIFEVMNNHKSVIKKAKQKYESALKAMDNTDRIDRELTRTRQKYLAQSLEEYKESLEEYNDFVEDAESLYKKQFDLIQEYEENRITFIKSHIGKFFLQPEELAKEYIEMHTGMKKVLEIVDPKQDLKVFTNEAIKGHMETKLFIKIDVENVIKLSKQTSQCIVPFAKFEEIGTDYENAPKPDPEVTETETNFMKNAIEIILSNKTLSSAQKTRFSELFQVADGRQKFATILMQLPHRCELENEKSFNEMLDLVNMFLTQFEVYNDKDISLLWSIMSASYRIIIVIQKPETNVRKVQSLVKLIAKNPIWKSREKWIALISQKIVQAIELQKISSNSNSKEKNKGLVTSLWSAGSKLLFGEKPEETKARFEKTENVNKSTANGELSNIALHLAIMQVDIDIARDLLIQFAGKYKIDKDKLYQILSDFECAQYLQRDSSIKTKEYLKINISRTQKKLAKYNGNLKAFIIGNSLKFINDIDTLKNILLISTEINRMLRKNVLKYCLRFSTISLENKHQIWKLLICDNKLLKNMYPEIISTKLFEFQAKNNSLESLIKLDVARSFFSQSDIIKESLCNILRCYAIYNPEVGYCQGMNFLAAMYYLVYKNESTSFSMLVHTIEKFKLGGLYKNDVPLLKAFIHKMNRLLALFLPKLHEHIYDEGINSGYLCSAWFITLFTYVIQSKGNIPLFLETIFNRLMLVFLIIF